MNKFLILIAILLSIFTIYTIFRMPDTPIQENIEEISLEVPKAEEQDKSKLIGTWQSDADSNLRREFKEDGSAVDVYAEGEALESTVLSWSLSDEFNKDPDFSGDYESGSLYLRLDNGRDFIFFKIVNLTDRKLQLINVGESGAISFTRT